MAAFRLPATQQKASGWWDAPPWIGGLQPQEFMPGTDVPSPKNFQVMRQEKTLALAQALQTYAEESGAPTSILCYAAWDLHRCMSPFMTLSRDDIVKAFLLKPTEEKCGTSPTLEEEAIFLDKEMELLQTPGVEPAKQITAPRSPSPFPTPWSNHHSSLRARESVKGIDADPNQPSQWAHLCLQEHDRVLEWWREFWSLVPSTDKNVGDIPVQMMGCKQATSFRLPAAQLE